MYKDKDKQREADRIRQQRRRDAKKTKGVTNARCDESVTIPKDNREIKPFCALPANFSKPDCQCQMYKTNRVNGDKHTINHGKYKRNYELAEHELNRVSLPDDVDYEHSAGTHSRSLAGLMQGKG